MYHDKVLERLTQLNSRRILITGARGMLGCAFVEQLAKYAPGCEAVALGKDDLDVRNKEQVMKWSRWLKDGWIIHCAAFVSVEGCASNPKLGKEIIVDGTNNLLELAAATNSKMFFPQTFLIYDGSCEFISEEIAPNPLSCYGQLKFEAEKSILDSSQDSLIIRMAGFFGGCHRDKNFVGKIIRQIAQSVERGHKVFQIGDRVWQPTWTNDLALNSLLLIANNEKGKFQMACHGSASFFELTQEIANQLNWNDLIRLVPVRENEVNSNELGRRPPKAVLDCRRLNSKGLDLQRPWKNALQEYLSGSYFNQFRELSNKISLVGDSYEQATS